MDEKLTALAKEIRKKILDLSIEHKDGHIAPSLSIVEIMVALYYQVLTDEDKLILSKGHACLSLYSTLLRKGFKPKISGHPDIETEEGISCTTGSLGHGLPIGVGMAFARKFLNKRGHIYVIIGDGECQEGTIWESMNLAQKYKLDNLTVIVDYNKLQALASVKDVMNEHNLSGKFTAFGANVIQVQGHDFSELLAALDKARIKKGIPRVIIADTIKGKGISYMENDPVWHSRIPDEIQLIKAYKELE